MPHSVPATRRADRRRPAAVGATVLVLALVLAQAAAAATLDVAGPPGASLKINGLAMGPLPLAGPLTLGPGSYLVESELDGYVSFVQKVTLRDDADHVRLQVRLDRLSRRTAWTTSVLYAGLGQFYVGHKVRGWVYAAAETGGLLTALAGELQRSNLRKDYLVLKDQYDNAINANEITYYRGLAAAKYADMEDAESVRNTGLIVAAAAVGVSVLDALITFPHVAAGPGPVPSGVGGIPDLPGEPRFALTAVHAGVKLTF